MLRYFLHIKSQNVYILWKIVIDTTNETAGREMAVYRSSEDSSLWFTRDLKEFLKKFKEI